MLSRAQIGAINAVRAILRRLIGKTLDEEEKYEAGGIAEAANAAETALTNVLVLDRHMMGNDQITDDDLLAPVDTE